MVRAQSVVNPLAGQKPSVRSDRVRSKVAHPEAGEQVEIRMYLSKLKELVPHIPRHRKVSKLEVIQHVIDYICDLQTALETQPRRSRPSDAGPASAGAPQRHPLALLPNTLLPYFYSAAEVSLIES